MNTFSRKKIIFKICVAVVAVALFLVVVTSSASALEARSEMEEQTAIDCYHSQERSDLAIHTNGILDAICKDPLYCDIEEAVSTNYASDLIKWIDLNADYKSLKSVFDFCKAYYKNNNPQDFASVLAVVAIKNGNSFSHKDTLSTLKKLKAQLADGSVIEQLYSSNKYFSYYKTAYSAIFSGIVGEYVRMGSEKIEYGISGFFPLASGYHYNHYDDFGAKRGYGYARKHLGHDFMGSVGTPIIAIEGGVVTELGWNQYGGWRIGVRSHCTRRYYYYAHLRKDKPFAGDLKKGDTVFAGQVIGYLGNTGYSRKENVNLKTGNPHLHLGLQIIFDESQIKGPKEIWIDLYAISKLLSSEKARTYKQDGHSVSKSIKQPAERIDNVLVM